MAEKTVSFTEIGAGLYAFTAEGDPNSVVIIGDESVMVVEAQAASRLARKVVGCIRGQRFPRWRATPAQAALIAAIREGVAAG